MGIDTLVADKTLKLVLGWEARGRRWVVVVVILRFLDRGIAILLCSLHVLRDGGQ